MKQLAHECLINKLFGLNPSRMAPERHSKLLHCAMHLPRASSRAGALTLRCCDLGNKHKGEKSNFKNLYWSIVKKERLRDSRGPELQSYLNLDIATNT